MKRTAPTPAVAKLPAFSLPAGQHPAEDHVDARGVMDFRGWQREGYDALRGKPLRILLAPTGSGKSTLVKALAGLDLEDPAVKVVIAVPQTLIADSFDPSSLRIGRRVLRWSSQKLIRAKGSVDALLAFLRATPGSAAERALVCTHQTLVMAHQRLMREHKGKWSPWAGVSLYLDEAHHSHADEDEGLHNRLGQVVAHWLTATPGKLLLATATWMRSNLLDIIPESRRSDFTRFVHTMEAHLEGMVYLREVSFRFLLGKPEEAIRAILAEGNRKTIVYLPHVASSHVQAKGGKVAALADYQLAVGKRVRSDAWTTTLRHVPKTGPAYEIRSLDFVTEEGRDDRKDELRAAISAGQHLIRATRRIEDVAERDRAAIAAAKEGARYTPDLLWALNLGKEGFDWPELERVIVIGDRGSILDVLQMMGRALRDHPGKTRAEFNVILPYEGKAKADVDQLRLYIKTILASLVVEWPLRLPRLGTGKAAEATQRAITKALDDPQKAADLIGAVVDAIIRQGDHSGDEEKIIGGAVDAAKLGLDESERKALGPQIRAMFSARTRAMIQGAEGLPFDVVMAEGAAGCVRMLAAQFGYQTLGELRSALDGRAMVTASKEQVRIFAQGRTKEEYEKERPDGYPCASSCMLIYKETFAEIRDGAIGKIRTTSTEEDVRLFASDKTKAEYDKTRPTGYPSSNRTMDIYGKTLAEIRDGKRGQQKVTAPKDLAVAMAQGKTSARYDAERLPGYPAAKDFKRAYGINYSEARDGVSANEKPSATAYQAWKFAQGKTPNEYNLCRPRGYPNHGIFSGYYGTTFAAFRDGPMPVI